MKTRVDARLRAEARRFALRFACEDCAHANDSAEGPRCGNGWPTRVEREALDGEEVVFCKEFEAR